MRRSIPLLPRSRRLRLPLSGTRHVSSWDNSIVWGRRQWVTFPRGEGLAPTSRPGRMPDGVRPIPDIGILPSGIRGKATVRQASPGRAKIAISGHILSYEGRKSNGRNRPWLFSNTGVDVKLRTLSLPGSLFPPQIFSNMDNMRFNKPVLSFYNSDNTVKAYTTVASPILDCVFTDMRRYERVGTWVPRMYGWVC